MGTAIDNIFANRNGKTIKRNCKFSVGDLVRITDMGLSYGYYSQALDAMQGHLLEIKNLRKNEGNHVKSDICLELTDEFVKEKLPKMRFVVVNKALHPFDSVMYLVYNANFKIALIINERGLELIRSSVVKFNDSKVQFRAL